MALHPVQQEPKAFQRPCGHEQGVFDLLAPRVRTHHGDQFFQIGRYQEAFRKFSGTDVGFREAV